MGQCTSDPKSKSSTNNDNYSNFDTKTAIASVASVKKLAEKKKLVIEPMVKIDISDESIYHNYTVVTVSQYYVIALVVTHYFSVVIIVIPYYCRLVIAPKNYSLVEIVT